MVLLLIICHHRVLLRITLVILITHISYHRVSLNFLRHISWNVGLLMLAGARHLNWCLLSRLRLLNDLLLLHLLLLLLYLSQLSRTLQSLSSLLLYRLQTRLLWLAWLSYCTWSSVIWWYLKTAGLVCKNRALLYAWIIRLSWLLGKRMVWALLLLRLVGKKHFVRAYIKSFRG